MSRPQVDLNRSTTRRLISLLEEPGMQAVVLGLSKDPNAKLAVLLIPAGGDRPTLAAKVPLTASAARSVERERQILVEVRSLVSEPIQETVPRVVDGLEFEGWPVLVLSAVAGTPMTSSYHSWRHTARASSVAADFAAVAEWLAEFQSCTAGALKPLNMNEGTSNLLRIRFDGDPLLGSVLSALEEINGRLGQDQTRRTAVQGDLWCGNLLVAGGKITGVVDWEFGSKSGEPVRDLVHFALSYALYLDRHTVDGHRVVGHPGLSAGTWGAGIEYAIDGQGWFPELFRQFIGDGLERLGAAPKRWRDASLAGIAQVAALADHSGFAHDHLRLLNRLTAREAVT